MNHSFDARGFAHDTRHLLCTIRLTAEVLANSQNSEVSRRGDRILRSVDRMVDLCSRVLDPLTAPPATPQNIQDLLQDVSEHLTPAQNVAVTIACPARLEALLCGEALFRSVFNLASNAVKAMADRPGSTLVLRAAATGQSLVISVEDNGPGLEARPSHARIGPGTPKGKGLGLKIVRGLAESMGGTLRLVRTGPSGTVFALHMPLTATPLTTDDDAAAAPPLAA